MISQNEGCENFKLFSDVCSRKLVFTRLFTYTIDIRTVYGKGFKRWMEK